MTTATQKANPATATREIREFVSGSGKKTWIALIFKKNAEGNRVIIWAREFDSQAEANRFHG